MIDLAPQVNALTMVEAWLYCATCTHNNKYDWRLPTHAEYLTSTFPSGLWNESDVDYNIWMDNRYNVVPVRDVK